VKAAAYPAVSLSRGYFIPAFQERFIPAFQERFIPAFQERFIPAFQERCIPAFQERFIPAFQERFLDPEVDPGDCHFVGESARHSREDAP
jgi:hypothetical protein